MAKFTKSELEVMQALWEHGEMKPAEIEACFPRSISNMAVRSLLRVLLEKKHVKRRKVSRAYCYRSVTARDKALKKMTRRMADVFAGGSSFALIAQLIKAERLTEDELRQLQELAAVRPPKNKQNRKGRS